MVKIKRITPASAMRVGAITGLIMALVMGAFVFGLQALFVAGINTLEMSSSSSYGSYGGGSSDAAIFSALSMGMMCILFFVNGIFGAIGGAISGLVGAIGYNAAAKWVGGIEVELDTDLLDTTGPTKAKRYGSSVVDSIYE